jgi:hypothetical protein
MMNTYNVELALGIMAYAMLGLSSSIYFAGRMLKIINTPEVPLALHLSESGKLRRRTESIPGIICALPMHSSRTGLSGRN